MRKGAIMNLLSCEEYREDVRATAQIALPWERLNNSSMLISGGTGLIGSFLTDVIMYRNRQHSMNCHLYILGRSEENAQKRFPDYFPEKNFSFVSHDINVPLSNLNIQKIDYVIHLASNTHPVAYATDPIGTITTNIWGLKNMLDFSSQHSTVRAVFASSNEIYGENRGDTELFYEDYCGYIDCNTLRAGYPESKRCGEALCQAYIKQMNLDIVIPRLTRSYGPTLLMSDSKAMTQFIRKAIAGEDIVLKSAGTQYYSYTYVVDAVSGLLSVLLLGEKGEAYNIADRNSDITLKELAEIIASICGKKVVFEIPDAVEAAGYSKATKARLDSAKIHALGWKPQYNISKGIARTVSILRAVNS